MKKALLLYPESSKLSFWSYTDVCKLVGAKYPAAPLGIITLAALLPQEWDIKLIDLNTKKLHDSDIEWADIVFIGGMISQQMSFLKLIDRVKSLGKKVAVGGPDPTSQPELYSNADYLILGEVEDTIDNFIKDFENGVESGIYNPPDERPDITTSPIPRFDLLNFDDYLMIGVQFCRGCPFNCEFCDIIELYGRKPRAKNADQILKELETLYNLGYRGHVDFVDDNFIGNKSKVKNILVAVKDWSVKHGNPFFYSTEASINLADDEELLSLMRDLDFRYVFIGIESADPNVLQSTQKRQNVNRKWMDDLNKIYGYGIVVNAGFIIGFDNEFSESARMMVDLVQNGKIPMAMVGLLYALPNTQLTRRLEKENRLFKNTGKVDDINDMDQASSGLNFITKRSRIEIIEDFIYIISELYSSKNYFDRCLELSKSLTVKPKFKPSFRKILKYAKAFIKVVFKLGFKPSTFYYFWRNFYITFFTKISSLETNVNLMAMFIHFSKQRVFLKDLMTQKNEDLTNAKQLEIEIV